MNPFIFISNRISKIIGNICKVLAYPFHFIFPKVRFTIPEFSNVKIARRNNHQIPKKIWQTNYSNKSTLPVYLNYLFNRLMSLDYEYRYVSTEERLIYIEKHCSEDVFESFKLLTDGAAQADLWRLIVLYYDGGIYLDIDANFVWPLSNILSKNDTAVYLKLKNNTEFTNYFIATAPLNENIKEMIDIIVNNIKNRDVSGGVFNMTGPGVFNQVLQGKTVTTRTHRETCVQGSFTNEHFQYLDKPGSKWTHKKFEDLLK